MRSFINLDLFARYCPFIQTTYFGRCRIFDPIQTGWKTTWNLLRLLTTASARNCRKTHSEQLTVLFVAVKHRMPLTHVLSRIVGSGTVDSRCFYLCCASKRFAVYLCMWQQKSKSVCWLFISTATKQMIDHRKLSIIHIFNSHSSCICSVYRTQTTRHFLIFSKVLQF